MVNKLLWMMKAVSVHLRTHDAVVHVGRCLWRMLLHHVMTHVRIVGMQAVQVAFGAVLHVIKVVHATVDEAVLAETELVASVELSLAHKTLEAAQVEYEIARSHDQLVRRDRLAAAVAFSWKSPI